MAMSAQELQLYLELVVNHLPTGRVIGVVERDGRYFVERDELLAVGVQLDAQQTDAVLALDEITGLRSEYDEGMQRLLLVLPSAWLPHQEIGSRQLFDRTAAQSSPGALLNYDLYYSDTAGASRSVSAWMEQRVFNGYGLLSNTGIWRRSFNFDGRNDGYSRYDTSWRYDQQDSLHSYVAGDLVSGALTWNSAVRLGGVQVARNFALRPDLITYPLPSFSGDAAVPSSVELFINNARVSSDNLEPGPFTLNNVPFISGAGQATVVTTDVQGRRVSTSVPFYVTDQLLQKGLSDYSISAGALRKAYGIEDFAYGSFASSASLRHGISDSFTLEGHVETGEDLRLAGAGGSMAVGRWGTLSSALAGSRFEGRTGQQYSLSYSYYSPRFGVAMQHIQRSPNYADLSVVSALENTVVGRFLPARSDQLTFSFSPAGLGSIGVGYFDLRNGAGQQTRLLNLSWSRSFSGNVSVYGAFNRLLGESGYSAQLQLVIPFDLHTSFTAGIERNSQGGHTQRVSYSRSAPSDGGLGYNLGYASGANDFMQASAAWRASQAQLQAGVYRDEGRHTYWGDLSGSLVLMDNALFASNRIDDAFVLVDTDGYADVPVRFEHQLLGRTDRNGHLLVPWVPSYYRGHYEIDPLGLPVNVRTPDVRQSLAVHRGSGARLPFDLREVSAASIVLADEQGQFLPRGSKVERVGGREPAYVGWDGLVYFEELDEQNDLRVSLAGGGQCEVRVSLPAQTRDVLVLGPLTCR
ncbi:MAG: fimbria/pilus outer membrane usher protein [Gammaproteobacteria bacterium]|nr:fimbria/pilus outer membrane usher protein [Gammaproteobacteria bacterium]MBU2066998.1 fimbria/pilus outer membrane usher protein [Gammaproteobacteria bacterium]MBU2138963.1 fimbria/pilus outer membrane usher protein [Gammaproteobacteria bacterium]MBU2216308.1 fimbria/pilus outer membrane usher protein [Gammaproteobacteria bacterium]MBU2322814.1 fimbria/pilus outer membrane usher protein [Gammaproteobacteria bacterium]